jgi:hypothetical protein
VAFLLADRTEVVLALDWTDFDSDRHSTIALYMMTSHGRATPLMWKTHSETKLRNHRNDYEDELLGYIREIVPPHVKVTVIADRGFGDQALYSLLAESNLHFVIRFRSTFKVTTAEGYCFTAAALVPQNGRARKHSQAKVTGDKTPVAALVCHKAKRMKAAWCLATSRDDLTASQVVAFYARRFTLEESFRDTKDPRFGLGLSATYVGSTVRRDRLFLIGAPAQALLTMLGAASEATGLDRKLKVNTVKHRTMSLFNQGMYWHQAIPGVREEWLRPLMDTFDRIVREQPVCCEIFGVI